MLIVELNSLIKSLDVQFRPETATIIGRYSGRSVRIDESCGQEEKRIFLEPSYMFAKHMYICTYTVCQNVQ